MLNYNVMAKQFLHSCFNQILLITELLSRLSLYFLLLRLYRQHFIDNEGPHKLTVTIWYWRDSWLPVCTLNTRCLRKKGHIGSKLLLEALNGLKSKSGRKQTHIEIQIFTPVYKLYKSCIHLVYHASEWYIRTACLKIA